MIDPEHLIKEKIHNYVFFYTLAIVAFTLPLSREINGLTSIILVTNWLLEGKFKQKLSVLKTSKILILFLGFYILLVLSFMCSTNISYGLKVLERNISWVIYPVVIFSSTILAKNQLKFVLVSFAMGCAIGIIICLICASYDYWISGEIKHFFYHQFASYIGMHAVYFSFYILVAMFIIANFYFKKHYCYSKKIKLFTIFLLVVYLLAIILLSSKIILVSLFFFLNIFLFRFFLKKQKIKMGLAIIIIGNILLTSLVSNIPFIRERFSLAINSNLELVKKDNYSGVRRYSGITIRLILWRFAVEIMSDEKSWLFGNYVGDARELQRLKASEYSLFTGKPNDQNGWPDLTRYNAHNQYIQYLLSMGLIGLGYFLLLLAILFKSAHQSGEKVFTYFLLLFCIFSISESTMERYWGIVFFNFITSLFVSRLRKN